MVERRRRVVAVLAAVSVAIPELAFGAGIYGGSIGPTTGLSSTPGTPFAGKSGVGKGARPGWHIIPSISLQELYSDNITLAPAGSELSDFVSEIDPTLTLTGNTRRLKMQLWYQMQNLIYADNSRFNKTNNLLQLGSEAELVKDHGFLDFSIRRRPQNISNTGRVAFDNVSVTNNLNEITAISVSPRWQQRFGSFASGRVQYTFDTVDSSAPSSVFSASDRNLVEGHLQSGARFHRLRWTVDYTRQDVTYSRTNTGNIILENEEAQLKYLITRHIALLGTLGYDNNSYNRFGSRSISGVLWNVGAQWVPSVNTSVEGTVGERYFGTTYSLNLKHSTRLTEWVASYTEEPTVTRQTLLEQVLFPVVDQFGNPIVNPFTGAPVELNGTIPTQTSQTVINKTFDTTFRFRLPKNTFELSLRDITREYQLAAASEAALTATAEWTWHLGFRTYLDTRLRWIKNDVVTGRTDQYSLGEVDLTHRLARTLSATAGYRHLQRDSGARGAGYTENRVYVLLTKTF